MLGLFAVFYAVLHFLCVRRGSTWASTASDIVRDIAKRPFILVGTLALLADAAAGRHLVQPRDPVRWAPQRWQPLHRAVYAIALLALLHFFWMRAGKNNFAEVAVYAAIVARAARAGAWRRATRGTRYFMKPGSHSARG